MGVYGAEQQPILKNRHSGPMGGCHVKDLMQLGPWAGRPTGLVGRPSAGTNRPQLRLRGLHVSSHSFGMLLNF